MHGRADNQLITTGHSREVKGRNTMTISRCKTQPLLMMAIQNTQKQERGTPLMSVNSHICGHLGQDYGKDYTHKSYVLTFM